MQEHHIKIQKTARYYSLGDINESVTNLWIVCHGYAQLASDFMKDFEPLINANTAIIAPEALSRFYTKGFFGKVGATWMTKEDRLAEIEDYVNYLQRVLETITIGLSPDVNINILGFSQGCSTVCRWVTYKNPDFDKLWICSGSIPDDLDWEVFKTLSKKKKIRLVYGTNDPFLGKGDISRFKKFLKEKDIKYQLKSFDGAHEINCELLAGG